MASKKAPALNYRIRVEIDHDYVEDGSDGKPLPESREHYDANPITPDGGPALSYEAYLETYGDPGRYTGYHVDLEQECPHCGEWKRVESIGTSLYDQYVSEGVYTFETAHPYFAELARDMIPD